MEAMRKGATSGVCLGLVALFGSEQLVRGMPGFYRRPPLLQAGLKHLTRSSSFKGIRTELRTSSCSSVTVCNSRGPTLSPALGRSRPTPAQRVRWSTRVAQGALADRPPQVAAPKESGDCSRQRGRPPVHPLGERVNHPTGGRVLTFDQPWGSTSLEPPRDCCVVKQYVHRHLVSRL